MMDSIHRSEEMCLAQLFLQNEAAYTCVAELGELGLVQFRDLNQDVSAFQRKYVKEVRRCDEMERKLRFLEREIKKDEIPMLDTGENSEAPPPREMFDLESTFEKLENELREVNQNEEMLRKNFAELTELKHILRKTQQFFDENEGERQALNSLAHDEFLDDGTSLIPHHERGGGAAAESSQVSKGHLKFIAGVIQRERLPAFERLLWRACRGNVFLRQAEITELLSDTVTGIEVQKAVFIIFFQGDQLKSRVKKICEGFRATIYPCPDSPQERREMSIGVMTRIEDLKTVLGQTQDHRHRVLVAAARNIRTWLNKVRKIKAIYHTLNLFNLDVTQKCLIAECWCPVSEFDRIQLALKRGSDESGSTVPSILNRMETTEQPPTFNRTNKFTRGFQNIVDAYGIANYREINPAPYTMVTFPFLFALMFGDLGHGIVMFAFGLFLVLMEKRLEAARITDEIFQMFFSGRYVIFLMGLFSIYTGLIYNDAFSKSFNLFGSSWGATILDYTKYEQMLLPEQSYSSEPYPLGVDPIWNLAETNKLNFLNSMKMKASIIIGICQMAFGIVLSYHNYKYFKSDLDIKFTFIPQMIFLCCIFVYLCLQIVVKWLFFDYKGGYTIFGNFYPGARCAPSLLIGLINMFMMKSRESGFVHGDHIDPQCHLNYWYPLQGFFESIFIPTAIGCVFVMLLAKPYRLWQQHQLQQNGGHQNNSLGVTELVLLCTAILAIPVMLFVKLLYLWKRQQKRNNFSRGGGRKKLIAAQNETIPSPHSSQQQHQQMDESFVDVLVVDNFTNNNNSVHANLSEDGGVEVIHSSSNNEAKQSQPQHSSHGGKNDFDLADIMVYQSIHTIEFALGCISHTASYLRLWALSLAHAQLSDVLWTMVFRKGLLQGGYFGAVLTYIIFFIFATLTLFILVLMEGLSAFLHALRLHWVEFQSKFYGGTGHPFLPFSFDVILEEARIAEENYN